VLFRSANAAKRSKNPLADKLPTESLSEFQTRKAKEQRAIIAKEEYNQTKRAGKSKKYHADKILKKKRKLQARNTTGYNGVCKSGKTFKAMIRIARKMHYLGTHATAKDAALAYDRAVIQHKLSSSKLNYPAPKMGVLKKYTNKKIHANNTTGYTGVIKNGKKFQALIRIDGKRKYLGTYAVLKEAALAYDRAVIQHKLSSSKLNFPNDYINSGEDDESSSDDDSDNDSDDDSDHEPTHARSPFPPAQSAQSQFQGDPMLDQLVAAVEAQTNK
jgi:hypothetical protein